MNDKIQFETKKIRHDTLGEYLTDIRMSLGMSAEEVSAKTGIQLKFLEALEQGRLHQLPADVYVLGFLRQLAKVYAAPVESLVEQYKRERGISQQLEKKRNQQLSVTRKYFSKLVVTPKMLAAVGAAIFVVLTVGYIVWQVLSINKTPSLEISTPQNRQVITETSLEVSGQTDPGISVTLNDQPVFVDNTGHFKAQVSVDNGPKELVFVAKNRFGKSITRSVSIIGQFTTSQTQGPLTLTLAFTGSANVTVQLDQGDTKSYSFVDGDSKTFTAQSRIVVSTTDAGQTRAILNGQQLGSLGRPGEQLQDIPFTLSPDKSTK
jgi:cytoskeletal protein RodZ